MYRSLCGHGRYHGFIHSLVLLKATLIALVWCNVPVIYTGNRTSAQKSFVYWQEKTHLFWLWSYLSDWDVKWHIPELISKMLFFKGLSSCVCVCFHILHINAYLRVFIGALREHALLYVGVYSHFPLCALEFLHPEGDNSPCYHCSKIFLTLLQMASWIAWTQTAACSRCATSMRCAWAPRTPWISSRRRKPPSPSRACIHSTIGSSSWLARTALTSSREKILLKEGKWILVLIQ